MIETGSKKTLYRRVDKELESFGRVSDCVALRCKKFVAEQQRITPEIYNLVGVDVTVRYWMTKFEQEKTKLKRITLNKSKLCGSKSELMKVITWAIRSEVAFKRTGNCMDKYLFIIDFGEDAVAVEANSDTLKDGLLAFVDAEGNLYRGKTAETIIQYCTKLQQDANYPI